MEYDSSVYTTTKKGSRLHVYSSDFLSHIKYPFWYGTDHFRKAVNTFQVWYGSIEYFGIISLLASMSNLQYLTLLSLHTITVLPLTTVDLVSEVHCTSNVIHTVLHLSAMLSHTNVKGIHTLQYKVVLLRSTVDYHLI